MEMRRALMAGVMLTVWGWGWGSGCIGGAAAQDAAEVQPKPLTGSYYMAPPIDAEDPNVPDDHIYMTVTGDAAKAMWDAMKVDTTPDECVGRQARWAKSLVCYGPATQTSGPLGPNDAPYECYLGVNLKTGELETGQDC
jgi:hypothetical protein